MSVMAQPPFLKRQDILAMIVAGLRSGPSFWKNPREPSRFGFRTDSRIAHFGGDCTQAFVKRCAESIISSTRPQEEREDKKLSWRTSLRDLGARRGKIVFTN